MNDNTFLNQELWDKFLAQQHDFLIRRDEGRDIGVCRKCGAPWIGPGEYAACDGIRVQMRV